MKWQRNEMGVSGGAGIPSNCIYPELFPMAGSTQCNVHAFVGYLNSPSEQSIRCFKLDFQTNLQL